MFRNTETISLYREIIETDWNMRKTDCPKVSVVSKCFETKLKKLWKRWKYQAPFLVFRNSETIRLYRESIETLGSETLNFYVKFLQCQLWQSLWWIWFMFGMNGHMILKCFRKEKCDLRQVVLSCDRSYCFSFLFQLSFLLCLGNNVHVLMDLRNDWLCPTILYK